VRICGEGTTSPNGDDYLIEAVMPAPGKFLTEGAPVEHGWYMLRPLSANKVDAWNLGRLGVHEWLGNGKVLLAVDTDAAHVTHIRLLDPVSRTDRSFDVPFTKSEGYVTVRAPDDVAVLLLQRVGLESAVIVRTPLSDAYVETLEISNSTNPGAWKLWRRGDPGRAHGEPLKVDASVLSRISWKGANPLFDGAALGPFEILDEDKPKTPARRPPAQH
jgi:hypothetical protein